MRSDFGAVTDVRIGWTEARQGRAHGDRLPHDLQEDPDAPLIVEALDSPNDVREGAVTQSYGLVDLERLAGAGFASGALHARKRLDQPYRQRKWKIAGPDQSQDTDGPVDWAPVVAAEVERYKDIPGEERCGASLELTRVANFSPDEWRQYGEALKDKVPLRLLLSPG
jgi:hypothetical protein